MTFVFLIFFFILVLKLKKKMFWHQIAWQKVDGGGRSHILLTISWPARPVADLTWGLAGGQLNSCILVILLDTSLTSWSINCLLELILFCHLNVVCKWRKRKIFIRVKLNQKQNYPDLHIHQFQDLHVHQTLSDPSVSLHLHPSLLHLFFQFSPNSLNFFFSDLFNNIHKNLLLFQEVQSFANTEQTEKQEHLSQTINWTDLRRSTRPKAILQ